MSIKLGIVMDPIESINVKKDTSLALLMAAQERNWAIHYMLPTDLYMAEGVSRASMRHLRVSYNEERWFELGEGIDLPLSDLDLILMRKDPPFDNRYIYLTYMLEQAQLKNTLVVNDPRSLRDCNEKLFATLFPQCCPPLLVTSNAARLRAFHKQHGDVIFKPLDSMGGDNVFRLRADDPNISVIIESMTSHGKMPIMAQKFIPEIAEGDKRILVIDGEPVPFVLARVPAIGETRGNLAAGGSGVTRPLTDRDRWICDQVAPDLKKRGLIFVGLDVIGDYLTEINITSPTCIREINRAENLDIAGDLMDCLLQKTEDR
ncbi:MAG: glutathione synthase [Pseudohongiellaceae bacterium]